MYQEEGRRESGTERRGTIMTESTSSTGGERERIEAALDDAVKQASHVERSVRLQFAQGWQSQPALDALPLEASYHAPGWVTFTPDEKNAAATGPVRLSYKRDARSGEEAVTLFMSDRVGNTPITAVAAAARLGVDIEVMEAAVNGATNLIFSDYALHQSIRELHETQIPQLEHDLEVLDAAPAEPEWATDSLGDPYTPERVTADWVQSTTMVKTYLECDRPDKVREWIETLDENLADFAAGGYPPESDELESVYHDAVARAAIPYGEAPISAEEVRRQLGNISRPVPEFDPERVRSVAGIDPLHRESLTRRLDAEPSLPTGVADVAAARQSVRRAIADISENTEQAQAYLGSANERLTHALQSMAPSQGRENVTAAQETLQQASEKVAAVAETAAKVEAEVTVYTTDGCPGCFATKRALDKAGVEYDEIPLKEHPELLAQFKRQLGKEGQKITAPVVQTKDGDLWAGYQPDKLKEHGLDHRTRQQRSGEAHRDAGHGR